MTKLEAENEHLRRQLDEERCNKNDMQDMLNENNKKLLNEIQQMYNKGRNPAHSGKVTLCSEMYLCNISHCYSKKVFFVLI